MEESIVNKMRNKYQGKKKEFPIERGQVLRTKIEIRYTQSTL